MRILIKSLALVFMVTFFSVIGGAVSGQRSGPQSPNYDPNTETAITGMIREVKEAPGSGRGAGTHLAVKTAVGVGEVYVGPTWCLVQQKYALAKGDEVEDTGSKVNIQDVDAIITRQIKKGGNTWTLRDAKGVPLWSRGRNR